MLTPTPEPAQEQPLWWESYRDPHRLQRNLPRVGQMFGVLMCYAAVVALLVWLGSV